MAGMGHILPSGVSPVGQRHGSRHSRRALEHDPRAKARRARPRARQIMLTAAERRRLKALAYSHTAAYQQVIRVRIVRDAAHGYANAKIACRQGVTIDTVCCWRGRYADEGLAGLADRRRSGRPPRFTPVQVAEVKALACQLPAETGVALSRWSCPDLAGEVVDRGIAPAVSASTIRRILAADALKPWQYQSWIFIHDPNFTAKATRVLDLYARTYNGIALGAEEYVISSDEKTSIQARCRCHPTLAPGAARTMRVNHEYDRGGTLPTWPPTTSTGHACSPAARPRPGSCRS